MRTRKLVLTSALFFVIGLVSLGSKWNGSAGVHAGDSLPAWSVNFSGAVTGLPAMIGVLALLAAVLAFIWALIKSLME